MSKLQQSFDSLFEINNFNNDFLLVRSKNTSDLAQLGKTVFKQKFDFVDEVIVTEMEVCIKVNHLFSSSHLDHLKNIEYDKFDRHQTYQVPVLFTDHDDWKEIESFTGFNKSEIISKLLQSEFSVAMFGFLPGFTYLNGLDKNLQVPRKAVPAKYVEANSLAIGGKYLGLYAIDSPGGWHVIGKTPISLLEIESLPPISINPGDRIVLNEIDQTEFKSMTEKKLTLQEYNA
ncbi:carboxyltransferase domain-containing protein [Namhaeicola litoreus]|uniref:Carboxyltransferase domain-containing protein n=1 Tax=Namhaeicola litoreus TaxID=1052145 RepID=A0ABW3XZM6_9FLAO